MTGREPSSRMSSSETEIRHASCVAVNGRAVLIIGASGQGKSALALQLLALGAQLVSDDRTILRRDNTVILADAPDRLRGLIEAREVGILRLPAAAPCQVTCVIDMDATETARLPEHRTIDLLGLEIPILRKSDLPHFPAAIMTYLRGQRDA